MYNTMHAIRSYMKKERSTIEADCVFELCMIDGVS
jgi:hypothetical protein